MVITAVFHVSTDSSGTTMECEYPDIPDYTLGVWDRAVVYGDVDSIPATDLSQWINRLSKFLKQGGEVTVKESRNSAEGCPVDETLPSKDIMRFFEYDHLPDQLQKVSKPICDMAIKMDKVLPDGAEKSVGLRKLLEAKDCFVRASFDSD